MDLNLLKKELFGGSGTGTSSPVSDEKPDWDTLIENYSSKYPSVPKNVVKAIIQQESGGNHKAVGPMTKYGTAKGAGQFIDSTAKQYIPGWQSEADSFNPDKTVAGIFNYMDTLIQQNKGDIKKAVGRYFGTGVDPVLNKSTDEYSSEVMAKAGIQSGSAQPAPTKDSNADFIKRTLFGDGPVQQATPEPQPVMQPITGTQQPVEPQFGGVIPEKVAPPQKQPGVMQDVGNALTAGAGAVTSGFYSIPAGLTSVFLGANNLLNKGINAVTGRKLFKDDFQTPEMLTDNKLVQVPKQVAEEARSKISTKDDDLIELVKKGDVGGAARFLGNWVFEQVPQQAVNMGILLAGVPNVEALTLMGMTTGGSKEVENKEKVKSGEITQEQSALSVLGNAGFEVGGEAFGDIPVADALKKAFAKKAGEVGVDVAKETLGKTFQRVLKGYFSAVKQEVPSEVVTTIGQALTDKYSGVRPDLTAEELFSEVVTTAAGTGLMGQAGAITGLQESNTIREGQKQQEAIQSKLDADPDFQRAMNTPDLTGTMQPIVDMQGYRDRMQAEQVQGDESIAGKISSEQQQPEVETPEGLQPEPAMKPIAQQPEEDTGPQEITATEDQLNVGRELVKKLNDVEFQGSNPGFKGVNKKTGKEVVIQPTYEFKDKISGGNITLYEEQLNEDILSKKLAEKRKSIESENDRVNAETTTAKAEDDIRIDNNTGSGSKKTNTISGSIETSNVVGKGSKSLEVEKGNGANETGKSKDVLPGKKLTTDVPSVQPVTEKQEESTVSPDKTEEVSTALYDNMLKFREKAAKDRGVFVTDAEKSDLIESSKKQAKTIIDAISSKDISELEARLTVLENKGSRKGFEIATGIALPNTAKGTREAIRKFVGEESYDAFQKEFEENRLKKEKEQQQKAYSAERDKLLDTKLKFDGESTTYRNVIDKLAGEGWKVEVEKKGIRQIYKLTNGKKFTILPKKMIGEYAEEKMGKASEKQKDEWTLLTEELSSITRKIKAEKQFNKQVELNKRRNEILKKIDAISKQTGTPEKVDLESTNNIKEMTENGKETSQKTEAVLNEKVETPSSDPNSKLVDDYVHLIKTHHGNKEKIPNTRKILDLADKAHGGTIAEGKYGIRDAYDALETAMNKYVEEIGLDEDPKETIKKLNNAIKVLPTQTVRTEDQVEKQQFSTPPSEAYLAVMASGIKPGMSGLEPSAGDGNIATIMRLVNKGDGTIHVNEIDERRRSNLKVLGFEPTSADAEYLHSTLPKEVQPDVVVMNPPFSATGGRLKQHDTGFGAEHVRQALLRLKEGGRLVAIVGNGMAFGKPKMASWWNGIREKYNVRANIGISGKEYEKYGTGFDNNIIVIDKTGKTGSIQDIIVGSDLTVEKAYDLLKPLIEEDVNGRIKRDVSSGSEKVGSKTPEGKTSEEKSAVGTDTATTGGSGRRSSGNDGTGTNKPAMENVDKSGSQLSGENGNGDNGKTTEGKEDAGAVKNEPAGNEEPDAKSGTDDTGRPERKPSGEGRIEEEEGGVYAKYKVKKAVYPGSVPHQADIVESATMASVDLPDVSYKLSIPKETIKKGAPSDMQLEAATYACQTHEQRLPDGRRKEFLLGDSTGTGKTITILSTIYENWLNGRKKSVVITKSKGLIKDLREDMKMMGVEIPVIDLSDYKMTDEIPAQEGILFSTYATSSGNWVKGKERYNQIKNWFGKDTDGVFVFDEAHMMKNANAEQPTNTGSMGVKFKEELRNARFLNASATAATNSKNLAYLTRMGLWGEGSSFKNFTEFLGTMSQGGLGAMELLSRDMKSNGNYISRTISYKGVDYETLNHPMNDTEISSYNGMADFWSEILQSMDKAAKNSGLKGRAARNHAKQYYAAQQRFFLQLMVSFQVETMLKDADKKLADGKSVVISLFNTNEQQTEKKVGDAAAQGIDIDDMDFTPRDMMIDMIKNNFPVYQYQEVQHDDGTKEFVQVKDDAGNPLVNAENEMTMNELVDKVATFKMPDNPLDRIVNYFGEGKVAEVTGRKKRLVMVNGKKVYKARASKDVSAKDVNRNELDQFMDGKKRIAVLSGAAATGFSFHASTKKKNQQRRVFYALQLSWSADQQMQAFGRVHRTMQASAPEIVLVQTDIASQKRLVNTIQSRLASLGAISKGERESLSGGIFSIEDITDEYGEAALRSLLPTLGNETLKRMGLLTDTGKSKETDVDGFMNRLMVLQVKDQNEIFDRFYGTYRDAVDKAKEAGLYDTGVEKIKGDNVRIEGEPILLSDDKQSGVRTEILNIAHDVESTKYTFKQMKERHSTKNIEYVKNIKSGDVYISFFRESDAYIYGPRGQVKKIPYTQLRSEYWDKYDTVTDEKEVEKLWAEKYKEIPKVSTQHTHILTGSIFNNYKKIFETSAEGSFSKLKVYRAALENGSSRIGVYIPQSMIEKIKQNFGIGTDLATASPETIIELVKGGSIIEFDNRWKLKESRVMGDKRIELNIGNEYNTGYIEKMGLFNEIIAGQKRYFVPTGDTMIETVKNIMERTKPVRDLTVKSEESVIASSPLFERDVTKENQIYSFEFKKWFGDWENDPENASKVVDESGKPLVVYKGMPNKSWETGEEIDVIKSKNGPWAGFFTSDKTVADNFKKAFSFVQGGSKIIEAYLMIQNPFVVDAKGKYARDFMFDSVSGKYDNPILKEAIRAEKYDGIIIKNTADEGDVYIPKESNQIKSATGNEGTFKKDNPNIYASAVPTFKITDLAKPITPEPVKVNPAQTVKTAPSGKKLQYAQASNRLGNQIADKEDKSMRDTGFISKAEAFYQKWVDLAFPISKVEDIYNKDMGITRETAREIDIAIDRVRGAGGISKQFIDDNLKPVFDNIKENKGEISAELSKYLVAVRTKWLYENKKNYADIGIDKGTADNFVEFVDTGAHPYSSIIKESAQKVWEYGKKLLEIKKEHGIVDDDLIANLSEPYYVPFYRSIQDEKIAKSVPRGERFTTISKGIKKIKGSLTGKKIIDPIQNMMEHTYETMVNAYRADVANLLVDMAEESEVIGEMFQKIDPKWVKVGTIEHRGTMDVVLRPQIDEVAKELGITTEYKTKLAARIGRKLQKVLGKYEEGGKLQMLVGATEETYAHELGHGIHEKYSWYDTMVEKHDAELNAVADTRHTGVEVPANFVKYCREKTEKAAEFISLYITDRESLKTLAPKMLVEFEGKIQSDPVLKKMIAMKPSNVKGLITKNENNFVQDWHVPQDADVISVLREGKIVSYRVPIEVADAVKNLHPAMFPAWFRIMMMPNRVLKRMAVSLNIDFMFPNMFRDQQEAAINARTIPAVDWLIGLKEYAFGGDYLKRYFRTGGGMESVESGVRGFSKSAEEMKYGSSYGKFLDTYYWQETGKLRGATQLSLEAIKTPFKIIEKLAEASEIASRVGTFRRAQVGYPEWLEWYGGKKKSEEQAMHIARQATLDFQRFGSHGRTVNEVVPFLNAAIQGIDRMVRTFKDDPKRALLSAMVYAIAPAIGLFLWNRDKELYKAINFQEKLNNFIVMLPDGSDYVKIPKGHITKVIINPIQAVIEKLNGTLTKESSSVAVDLLSDLSPVELSSLPITLRMVLEPAANYDFYWKRQIESPAMQGISKAGLRTDARTSYLIKQIGKAINISPAMIQHETELLGAGTAKNALWLADNILVMAGISDGSLDASKFGVERAPVARRFYGKITEWGSDIDEAIRDVNTQLSKMNETTIRQMRVRLRYSDKEIQEVIKSNNKTKNKLYIKRGELEKAKGAITELINNQE